MTQTSSCGSPIPQSRPDRMLVTKWTSLGGRLHASGAAANVTPSDGSRAPGTNPFTLFLAFLRHTYTRTGYVGDLASWPSASCHSDFGEDQGTILKPPYNLTCRKCELNSS